MTGMVTFSGILMGALKKRAKATSRCSIATKFLQWISANKFCYYTSINSMNMKICLFHSLFNITFTTLSTVEQDYFNVYHITTDKFITLQILNKYQILTEGRCLPVSVIFINKLLLMIAPCHNTKLPLGSTS